MLQSLAVRKLLQASRAYSPSSEVPTLKTVFRCQTFVTNHIAVQQKVLTFVSILLEQFWAWDSLWNCLNGSPRARILANSQ